MIPVSELQTPFELPAAPDDSNAQEPRPEDSKRFVPPPTSNLPEQFRATLARLLPAMTRLKPLPIECSFTLAIELRDERSVETPLRRGEDGGRWIAAEPRLQKERDREEVLANGTNDGRQRSFQGRAKLGRDLGGVRTTPVRSLEAGAFAMEVWVEEGKGKFVATVEDAKEKEDEKVDPDNQAE